MCLSWLLDLFLGPEEDDYDEKPSKKSKNKDDVYKLKKSIMSDCEINFFKVIYKHFEKDYLVIPQVPLASIIEKKKDFDSQYQNELNRIIDFGIFDKITFKPLLLIEINDNTHNEKSRQARDIKVKNICSSVNLNLITFYTNYPNKEDYIIDRISKELKKD